MKFVFSPEVILCGLLGSKHQLTNQLTNLVCFKIQNTQEIKIMLFNLDETGQNVHIFEEVLLFKLRTTKETEKRTINSTYVSWMWEAGEKKRAQDCLT